MTILGPGGHGNIFCYALLFRMFHSMLYDETLSAQQYGDYGGGDKS